MERIRQKPTLQETIRRKAKAAPEQIVIRGKERAIRSLQEQLRDAAEGGNRREDREADEEVTFIVHRAVSAGRAVIKTKERYIEKSASTGEPTPQNPENMVQQGRELAIQRAEDIRQRTFTRVRDIPVNETEEPFTPNPTVRDRSVKAQKRDMKRHPLQAKATAERRAERPVKSRRSSFAAAEKTPTGVTATGYSPAPVRMEQRRRYAMQSVTKKGVSGIRGQAVAVFRAIGGGSRTAGMGVAAVAGACGAAVAIVLVVFMLGCTLSLFGGGQSNAAPVSPEVRVYEPTIRLYAAQYGIPEYVELIMAVMMQESGGRGLDPMQAAEGSFNARYPHVPNGITDPDYSIACGVQELKAALERGDVQSPVDMEHIKLALQGYNYGPGYITWAVRNYGGYSAANAAEFSDLQASRLGWGRYGDKDYVPHVLRYYAFGQMPMGMGNMGVVQIALSQVGNDGTIYWTWFGHSSRVAWCSEFASWCAYHAGLVDAGLAPKTSNCDSGVAWFRERGRFVDSSYVPTPGDFIYFDWDPDGSPDHVGIVEYVEDGKVHTVEGNSGDRVRRSSYALGSGVIFGYGIV